MAEVDLGKMEFDHVEAINNSDIINLVAIIDMGLNQFSKAPSSTTNHTHQEDVRIARGWIGLFEQRYLHFSDNPELYMPKAHPKPKNLPEVPEVNIVQNSALQNLMYNLSHLRTELLHCEDAERLNGFHPATSRAVVLPWIEKFQNFLGLMEENLEEESRSWFPDADLQEPGVNPGEPR